LRTTIGVALGLALVAAACGSNQPPTPPPATPAPSVPDPRSDAIDQHAGTWGRRQPAAYAYTLDHEAGSAGGQAWQYHVAGLEGATQVQHLSGAALPDTALGDVTVAGLFQRARDALADPGFQVAFDARTGYPTKLTFTGGGEGEAGVETVQDFRTPTTQGGVARAQAALGTILQRWHAVDAPRWAYTWSRIPAGSSGGQPITWNVAHAKGATTAKQVAAGSLPLTADDVSIDGTVSAIQAVLVSGGWADVAMEDDPGLGVLIAVDPQPGAKGDAYWIRIAWTDLARQASISGVDAAKARWATAQLTDYSYTWDYRGAGGPLSYKVSRHTGTTTVTPAGATPVARPAWATPLVEDTFAMIDAVLAEGGTVDATYDGALGYPTRLEIHPAGGSGANGVVTIKGFKHR
jgi:Family of unknown function (DUF6174)